MLIFCLVKGVPAKTTQVVTVAGVLRREEMELVLNPHDVKAVEAAYYVKKMVGGKIIGISMGPEPKIAPIMDDLAEAKEESRLVPRISFEGFDERIILSDRRMAGADTWATAYTLACGINRVLKNHFEAADKLIQAVENESVEKVVAVAEELYEKNLIPHYIYSKLKTMTHNLVARFQRGEISKGELLTELHSYRSGLSKFIIITGMKTSDGETGNVGPQTAEALSQMVGKLIPSIAFTRDFEISLDRDYVIAERKIGNIIQKMKVSIPCLLTIDAHYEPRVPAAGNQKMVRGNSYPKKIPTTFVWNADYIEADPSKIGFMGSPTIVGPGYEIGKPPTQKFVGETLVFKKDHDKISWNDKSYGPFKKGDPVNNLPQELVNELIAKQVVGVFTIEDLLEEVFGGLKVVARAV
ncbi:MAG: hypothetical protein RMI43_05970 [Candidatus Caldarchaeum sp.]|nr:hypothetical protein [Candidatus Caldarchaeum sp.]